MSITLDELKLKLYLINKEIPDINYGGCGTFSYHLRKVLEEKYNIKSEIYYLPGPPANIKYDVLFSHIVIKVNDTIVDNNGLYDLGSGWIEKIKSKKVNSDGLEESDLYEITFEPNFNDVDDDTIQYLIRMNNSPIGKNMKFYFLSNDLQSAIGAEII